MCRRNTQMLFLLVKLHAFTLSSNVSFIFIDVCWLNDKVKVLLGSSVFNYKTQLALDGMDLLEIGPLDACKKDFIIDEAMWKTFKSDCAVKGQEKSEGKFLKLAKRRKKTAFKSKETVERMRSDIRISGCPVYTSPKSTGTSGWSTFEIVFEQLRIA